MQGFAWLLCLLPGVLTGQLWPRAQRMVHGWTKDNATWSSLEYWPLRRALFWGTTHPVLFVLFIAATAIGAAHLLCVPHFGWPAVIRSPGLDEKYDLAAFVGVPWSVQATVVSLVYPIVLSYIALLLQRRARSTALQQVYQMDSAVVPAGSSSLALLLVMSFEYFAVPHLTPEFRANYLTVFLVGNWAWLALNLVMTGYFVSRTLRFLQDSAQEEAYTRVAVAIALRRELWTATHQHIYVNVPDSDWKISQKKSREDSLPRVMTFSVGGGVPAVSRRFKSPRVLRDVRTHLLAIVVRSWLRRAEAKEGEGSPRICFPPMVGEPSSDNVTLCTIDNGPELTRVEKFLVRAAFDFRLQRKDNVVLSTRDMLEELSFEVRASADSKQFDAARGALRRMFRLHETLLRASLSSSEGASESMAAMSTSPYGWGGTTFGTEWLRSYRELAAIAAHLIPIDRRLLEGISSVPARVARSVPPTPAKPILDGMQIASSVVHELGAWWTKVADEGLAATASEFDGLLPQQYRKAYEHALTTFVGTWGHLHVEPSEAGSDEEIWQSLSSRAVVYARHIDLGAQFFLKAVARGDVTGAEWFLESFLKWWGNRQHELDVELDDEFQLRHVTLKLSDRSWSEVQEFLRIDETAVSIRTAGKAMNVGLQRYWESMRLYLAVLLVSYAGHTPKLNCLELRLAAVLLAGKAQRRGGRVVVDALDSSDDILNGVLSNLYGIESHRGRIDSFAESLQWESESPEVSGWIYGWSGSPTSLHAMQDSIATLLLAIPLPRGSTAIRARRLIQSWWKDLDKLSAVSTYLAELRRHVLSGGYAAREPAAKELQRQLKLESSVRVSRLRLAQTLRELGAVATAERLTTLRARKVDERKVRRFASGVSEQAFGLDSWPRAKGIALEFLPDLSTPLQYFSVEDYKSRFTIDGSEGGDRISEQVVAHVRQFALQMPLREVLVSAGIEPVNTPSLRHDHDVSLASAQEFLSAVALRCDLLRRQGHLPIIIIGNSTVSEYLSEYRWGSGAWQYALPSGISVVRSAAADGERGQLSVNGVSVIRLPTPNGDCYVIPAVLIARLQLSGQNPSSVVTASWELVNDERIKISLVWAGRFAQSSSM